MLCFMEVFEKKCSKWNKKQFSSMLMFEKEPKLMILDFGTPNCLEELTAKF